ncbi:Phasin protein [Bradyrhizobium sp.]|uniref:Phasin protein n=1 Tax=Bradyrhizobium sp. TaxID=376 RepID=UPI002635CD91|nr:Phasin protein [Bradyrhizobium sp.]
MSKRKQAMTSKHAHVPKIAVKAQRAAQAIVRSPKNNLLPSAGAGPTEPPPEPHNNPPQESPLVEDPTIRFEDDSKQMATDNDSKKGTKFPLATANVQTYQAKLLEIALANMQLAFEFSHRLATVRSPLEFPGVISEFTSKRVAMFRKHSTELAELAIKR